MLSNSKSSLVIFDRCQCCFAQKPRQRIDSFRESHLNTLVVMIEQCFSVEIYGHNTECIICDACAQKLIESHSFKCMIMESQAKFIEANLECFQDDPPALPYKPQAMYNLNNDGDARFDAIYAHPVVDSNDDIELLKTEECSSRDVDEPPTTESSFGETIDDVVKIDGSLKISPYESTETPAGTKSKSLVSAKQRNKKRLKHRTEFVNASKDERRHTNAIIRTLRSRIPQPRFDCDYCPKSYKWNFMLLAHIKSVHGNPREFKCNLCGKLLNAESLLRDHIRNHENLKNYRCDLCLGGFNTLMSLTRHMHAHSGQYHKCTQCPKSFNLKGSLRQHMLIHKRQKYICEVCHKVYHSERYLNVHIQRHLKVDRFECAMCYKVFSVKSDIRSHIRNHMRKPYACTSCPKRFVTDESLNKHRTTHNERELVCAVCGITFLVKQRLISHIKLHMAKGLI